MEGAFAAAQFVKMRRNIVPGVIKVQGEQR
jgi:hypothetical protein